MKPDVLVVADYPNWAYHHIANFITEALSDEYNIFIDFVCLNRRDIFSNNRGSVLDDFKRKARERLQRLKFQKIKEDGTYDLVLYLAYFHDVVGEFKINAKKVIKGIYTQGFPPQGMPGNFDMLNRIDFRDLSIKTFFETYLKDADAIVCGAPVIEDFYRKFQINTYSANLAYNEKEFLPRVSDKKKPRELIVGWTGTPDRSFKGFHSHVVPAVERANAYCGGEIKLKTRFSGSLKTLPLFYQDVDIVVIASEADAGPSLFIEASLCGIPAITTPVGMPFSVVKDGVNGFLVARDIGAIADKIIQLHHNRSILESMRSRIRNDFLEVFGWGAQVQNWRRLFSEVLRDQGCSR